jgi:hypothetical protein
MAKIKFPVLAVILLIAGIVWMLNDLGYLVIDDPWIPVVLVVIAIGMIANRYSK